MSSLRAADRGKAPQRNSMDPVLHYLPGTPGAAKYLVHFRCTLGMHVAEASMRRECATFNHDARVYLYQCTGRVFSQHLHDTIPCRRKQRRAVANVVSICGNDVDQPLLEQPYGNFFCPAS